MLRSQTDAFRAGIRSWNHPLGEVLPPNPRELGTASGMMQLYRPMYVHCRDGVDRTGMVIAYHRIHNQGWKRSTAIAEMKALGMHPWYFYWAWCLR